MALGLDSPWIVAVVNLFEEAEGCFTDSPSLEKAAMQCRVLFLDRFLCSCLFHRFSRLRIYGYEHGHDMAFHVSITGLSDDSKQCQ